MQGDVVKACRWLGGCIVLASIILVVGFHPTVRGCKLSWSAIDSTQNAIAPVQFTVPPATLAH